jgi:putative endonuclease
MIVGTLREIVRRWSWSIDKPGRLDLGARGEKLAAEELERRGYRIVARRWRCRLGEIDLVAYHGETLVIVEVKTRRIRGEAQARGSPSPQDAVGRRKRRKLVQLTHAYLAAKRIREQDVAVRIDVVGVGLRDDGGVRFEVLSDAFGEDEC